MKNNIFRPIQTSDDIEQKMVNNAKFAFIGVHEERRNCCRKKMKAFMERESPDEKVQYAFSPLGLLSVEQERPFSLLNAVNNKLKQLTHENE